MTQSQGHAELSQRRIAVTGSSGLVGSRLVRSLEHADCLVERVVRTAPQPGSNEIHWNPLKGLVDRAAFEGVDAVVHLAGENVGTGRWTAERKEAIRRSRVDSTRLLCEALAALDRRCGVLIAASAIGYYGNRGDTVLTEESKPGQGFLPGVCRAWEAATEPARQAGIRVVNLRIGVVLSTAGGALARMLTPFKRGVGGRLGTGRQYMSWIGLDDLIGIIQYLIAADEVSGPVNAVTSSPLTNAEFTRTLGRVLRRPTVFPIPAPMIRLLFGEMGRELLLASARVKPARLQERRFGFRWPELESALRHELGRRPG